MSTLSTDLKVSLAFDFKTSIRGVQGRFNPQFIHSGRYADGAAVNQSNMLWYDNTPRSLGATTDDDIDLSGIQTTPYGSTILFTIIKGMFVQNLSEVVGDELTIGGAASFPFLLFDDATDVFTLGPGGVFFFDEPSLAGKPVTAGTGDILRIGNAGANAITYNIAIWGV